MPAADVVGTPVTAEPAPRGGREPRSQPRRTRTRRQPGDQCLTIAYQGRHSSDRPSFSGPRQFSGPRPNFNTSDTRPPFRPSPRVEVPAAPISHSLRLRDGDREIEVSGSAAFVRQVLDDLPAMWTRLHGEGSTRPARIDLPARSEACAGGRRAAASRARERARAQQAGAPAAASNGKHTPHGARRTTRCWRCSRTPRDRSRWLPSESASAAASRPSRCAASSNATLRRYRSPTSGRPPTVCARPTGARPRARQPPAQPPGAWGPPAAAHNCAGKELN